MSEPPLLVAAGFLAAAGCLAAAGFLAAGGFCEVPDVFEFSGVFDGAAVSFLDDLKLLPIFPAFVFQLSGWNSAPQERM